MKLLSLIFIIKLIGNSNIFTNFFLLEMRSTSSINLYKFALLKNKQHKNNIPHIDGFVTFMIKNIKTFFDSSLQFSGAALLIGSHVVLFTSENMGTESENSALNIKSSSH